jgi:hypothetical protein
VITSPFPAHPVTANKLSVHTSVLSRIFTKPSLLNYNVRAPILLPAGFTMFPAEWSFLAITGDLDLGCRHTQFSQIALH